MPPQGRLPEAPRRVGSRVFLSGTRRARRRRARLACARKDPRGACDLVGPFVRFSTRESAARRAGARARDGANDVRRDVPTLLRVSVVVSVAGRDEGNGGPPPRGRQARVARLLGAGWLDAAARPALRRRSPAPRGSARFGHPAVQATTGRGGGVRSVGPVRPRGAVVLPGTRPTATATRHRPVSHRPFPRTNWRRVSYGPAPTSSGRSAPRPRWSNAWRGWSETGRLDRRSRPEAGPAGPCASAHREKATKRTVALKGTRAESRRPRTRCCTGCSTPRPGGCGPCQGWTAPPRGPRGTSGTGAAPRGLARTSSSFDPRRAAPTPTQRRRGWRRRRRRKPGRRAMDINAELRDVAEAHRRAFAARRARFVSRPARTGGTRRRRSSRGRGSFAVAWRRVLVARRVAESAAIARAEAVASVARVCTETLRDDASTPDARSNAAMALSVPRRCSTFMKVLFLLRKRSTADERARRRRPRRRRPAFRGSPSPRRTRFAMR